MNQNELLVSVSVRVMRVNQSIIFIYCYQSASEWMPQGGIRSKTAGVGHEVSKPVLQM